MSINWLIRIFFRFKFFGAIAIILIILGFFLPKDFGTFIMLVGFAIAIYGLFKDENRWLSGSAMAIFVLYVFFDLYKVPDAEALKKDYENTQVKFVQDSVHKVKEEIKFKSLKAEYEDLYYMLLKFKNTKEFKEKGFGQGSKYSVWLTRLKEINTQENSQLMLNNCGILFGDLEMLGLEYASNGGSENKYTRDTKKMIEDGFNGIKSYE